MLGFYDQACTVSWPRAKCKVYSYDSLHHVIITIVAKKSMITIVEERLEVAAVETTTTAEAKEVETNNMISINHKTTTETTIQRCSRNSIGISKTMLRAM